MLPTPDFGLSTSNSQLITIFAKKLDLKSNHFVSNEDTIVALATAPGIGAIAVIRLSGREAITLCNKVFKGKDLEKAASHTVHFGTIRDGEKVIDEVLVTLFIAPKKFRVTAPITSSGKLSSYF